MGRPSLDAFQSEIRARMGERLVVDVRSGTTLGSENALLAAAQSGAVDISILTGPVVSTAVPEFGVFDMPFVFRDWAHVKAVSEGPLAEQIAPKFAAKGLALLAIKSGTLRLVLAIALGPSDLRQRRRSGSIRHHGPCE